MIVASTYKDGVGIQLCCNPDIDSKTVSFGVHILTNFPPELFVPIKDIGHHSFETWPEAVDFFNVHHQMVMDGTIKEDSYVSKV